MVSLGPPTGWTPAATPGDPRIRYVSGDLAGDIEDLEEHEVRASVPYEDRVKLAEKEQIIFEEAEARGLDAKAVTPPHYVAPRSPPRVMLPLVPNSDSDSTTSGVGSPVAATLFTSICTDTGVATERMLMPIP